MTVKLQEHQYYSYHNPINWYIENINTQIFFTNLKMSKNVWSHLYLMKIIFSTNIDLIIKVNEI